MHQLRSSEDKSVLVYMCVCVGGGGLIRWDLHVEKH